MVYKHSKNLGDLISVLPGLKNLYETKGEVSTIYQRLDMPVYMYNNWKHPVTNELGEEVCMNKYMFDMAYPLLKSQPYIKDFIIFEGQDYDVDLDSHMENKFIPIPASDIHHWQWFDNPELSCDLSKAWLRAKPIKTGKIIINFTERFRNPYITYFFLKKYQTDILFSGNQKEWEDFCRIWGLEIERLEVTNFLQLAELIHGCKFFLGNQSMNWHIADALKVRRILEASSQFPNTLPTGANGYAFMGQKQLEYLFEKLYNER